MTYAQLSSFPSLLLCVEMLARSYFPILHFDGISLQDVLDNLWKNEMIKNVFDYKMFENTFNDFQTWVTSVLY